MATKDQFTRVRHPRRGYIADAPVPLFHQQSVRLGTGKLGERARVYAPRRGDVHINTSDGPGRVFAQSERDGGHHVLEPQDVVEPMRARQHPAASLCPRTHLFGTCERSEVRYT